MSAGISALLEKWFLFSLEGFCPGFWGVLFSFSPPPSLVPQGSCTWSGGASCGSCPRCGEGLGLARRAPCAVIYVQLAIFMGLFIWISGLSSLIAACPGTRSRGNGEGEGRGQPHGGSGPTAARSTGTGEAPAVGCALRKFLP